MQTSFKLTPFSPDAHCFGGGATIVPHEQWGQAAAHLKPTGSGHRVLKRSMNIASVSKVVDVVDDVEVVLLIVVLIVVVLVVVVLVVVVLVTVELLVDVLVSVVVVVVVVFVAVVVSVEDEVLVEDVVLVLDVVSVVVVVVVVVGKHLYLAMYMKLQFLSWTKLRHTSHERVAVFNESKPARPELHKDSLTRTSSSHCGSSRSPPHHSLFRSFSMELHSPMSQ
mmetsp:Transcript_9466/g.27350  ORF Transcript_9466/g.27350 Transcript_9466/m.27350 type:complete len:223 (+) Transcript_9466:1427-2095(+)